MERPVRSSYMDIVERTPVDGDRCRVIIAANEKVRQPPELDFTGLSIDNYARNPVVMWAHDAVGRSPSGGLPIGRTLELKNTTDGKIVADFEFLSDDPFAQRVKNAWDKGFLQAASISWVPLESIPLEGGRWRDVRADLLEWSIVSVPADPDALRDAHRRMIETAFDSPDKVTESGLATSGRSRLVMADDEHRDLSTALGLLRRVIESTHPAARESPATGLRIQKPGIRGCMDLTVIAKSVGDLLHTLRTHGPTSGVGGNREKTGSPE